MQSARESPESPKTNADRPSYLCSVGLRKPGSTESNAQCSFPSMVSGCVIFLEYNGGNQAHFDIKAYKIACVF